MEHNIDFTLWYKGNFINEFIPRKCKDFNWRIFHGLVNTEAKLNLMKYSNGNCKLCIHDTENLEHLLHDCTELTGFWTNMECFIRKINQEFHISKFIVMTGYFDQNQYNEAINVILSISKWCIWKRRNNFKYEQEYITTSQLYLWVKNEVVQHFYSIIHDKNKKHNKTYTKYYEKLNC